MKEDTFVEREEKILYENLSKIVVKNLNKKFIDAFYVPSKDAALEKVVNMVPEGAIIGTADSITLMQLGVLSALKKRGKNEIINPFLRNEHGDFVVSDEERANLQRKVFFSDVYLVGTNAITLDGKLVNTDGGGNRVAAMIFGPKKVIIVAGTNKLVKDIDEALSRICEYCAPLNAIRHAHKHNRPQLFDLACVKTGICIDCHNPERICHFTTIIDGVKEIRRGHMSVVLVGEKLGI